MFDVDLLYQTVLHELSEQVKFDKEIIRTPHNFYKTWSSSKFE